MCIKISVIIPTYKPKEYFWTCLKSIRSQTFSKDNFEVIIVLNGCNEPWKTNIKNYLAKEFLEINVNFIHTEQIGVSNARNLALNAAKGDYIAFIDDDDFVSPDYLKELYSKAADDTIPLCYPLSFIDGSQEYQSYSITDNYTRNACKGKCDFKTARKFFSGPVYKLISRRAIGDRRFDEHFSNGEDSIFMFLISDTFHYVDFTSKNAIYYRRIRANSATTMRRRSIDLVVNEIQKMVQFTRIFISAPRRYSLNFYITRMLGAIRSILVGLKSI